MLLGKASAAIKRKSMRFAGFEITVKLLGGC